MTGDEAQPGEARPPIWTRAYLTLGGVVLLNNLNQAAIRPLLPLYIIALGGTESVAGVALAAFSLVSFVVRGRIGHAIDTSGAARVLFWGSTVLALFTVGLSFGSMALVIALFTVRGVGWAAVNAGGSASLARHAPESRRGEASGYYALFQSSATTVAPAVALWWVARTDGFVWVFVVAGILALGAALLSVSTGRASGEPRAAGRPRKGGFLFARSALLPGLILAMATVSQPAILIFFPLYAIETGLGSAQVSAFYVISGSAALIGRALLGRLSDHAGRAKSIVAGFSLMVIAFVAVLQAGLPALLIVSGGLYSLGQGLVVPAVTALAIDRAAEGETGHAMASFSAAHQVGMGIGGLLAGTLAGAYGYATLYVLMAVIVLAALSLTLVLARRF